ncbi:MAG TPA: SulP family inorganic anion transporter [Telluria sp.]|nr:SulP family inorganic anion transporter [Telluria sp.]
MLHWLRSYRRDLLAGDLVAGVVVAMMMIPQGMAYALVAGLPPVAGIYASIVPSLCYALFGTSMTQSVGPMAIVSLMTAAALAPLAPAGSGLYHVLAAQLALMAGAVLLASWLLRAGFLANFFSRPVMSGFTLGATIVIVWDQLGPLTGGGLEHPHRPSLLLGGGAVLVLVALRRWLGPLLVRFGVPRRGADVAVRLVPMAVVLASLVLVALLDLPSLGVRTTGEVPSGLPALNLATSRAHWGLLLQPALLIGFVIFLVSMSGAQALALRRQEKVHSNWELLALGAANVGSALSGGFPVTGSLSRSAVNFAAGAQTPLASVVTALLLAVALVAPTGWLALLPLPVLAATIIVAVSGLIEWNTLVTAWRYDRGDAAALLATAAGVLVLGVQGGVVLGVVMSLATIVWRASRPHIAVLGRLAGTEHFRNIERYPGTTQPGLLILRVDANLFFGNVEAVNERIEDELAARPELRDLVLVLSGVNTIDTTALFALGEWNTLLSQRGIRLHLAEVKGPVLDRLRASSLPATLSGKIYLSTAMAADDLAPA